MPVVAWSTTRRLTTFRELLQRATPRHSTHDGVAVVNALRRTPADVESPAPAARTALIAQAPVRADALAALLQRTVARRVLARAAGPLSPAQEKAAIAAAKDRFNNIAIRALQLSVRTTSDGAFGPKSAQAVAKFQAAVGHPQDGIVDETTLDAIVQSNHTGRIDSATLAIVTSFYGLGVGEVLSMLPRPDGGPSTTEFESGRLRVIRIGRGAFTSAAAVRDAITAQLEEAPAAQPSPAASPAILTGSEVSSAIAFNGSRWGDRRSVIAVQSFVGASPTGAWDASTLQRVARFQRDADYLDVDGKVGEQTLREIAEQLISADVERNSLLRLIVDFYKLDQTDLIDISYDAAITGDSAVTSNVADGPSKVRVGLIAFTQGFEGLVHTVAHELEHVRQSRVGIRSSSLREFLGERIEILSKGMLEEDFAGFADDARRALVLWHGEPPHVIGMTEPERRSHWPQFEEIRKRVRKRFAAADAEERTAHAQLLVDYNAVVKP